MEYNKKSFAEACGISRKTFWEHLKTLLTDTDFKKKFGEYRFKKFTSEQVEILKEYFPLNEGK